MAYLPFSVIFCLFSVVKMNFDASAYVNVGIWEADPDDSDIDEEEDETPGILQFTQQRELNQESMDTNEYLQNKQCFQLSILLIYFKELFDIYFHIYQ
jgi:hypothetical protein